MENLEQIIAVASAGVGLLATLTGFLIPLVKSVKAKNKLMALKRLSSVLQSLIMDAEQFVNFSGEEKKEYVLTKANRYAIENNIPFDESAVDNEIEKIVNLSKNVNVGLRTASTTNVNQSDKYKIG